MKEYKWNYLMSSDAQPMFEHIVSLIHKHNCRNVLDIGCGYSRISDLLDMPICGVDLDEDAIRYCNTKYSGEYKVCNCMNLNTTTFYRKFDCLVLAGLLYYFKDGFANGVTMTEYLNKLIKEFNPKLIIVAEPQARADYNGPDYTEFLETFNPKSTLMSLDIRMGDRVIYEIAL